MAKVQKKPVGKAVANWDQELADAAANQGSARSTGSGGKFINTRGAVFSLDGDDIGSEMNVVILDYCIENQFYGDKTFDPDNPSSPVCFAFGREEGELAPHDLSPEKQNDTCLGCPQNAYGSAGKGRKGKACKNVMRLALITEGDLEDIEAAEVHYLKVSVTNVKHFAKFLDQLKNPSFGKVRPSWAVLCEATIKPDKVTQIQLGFKRGADIDDGEQLAALKAKVAEQDDKIMFPYQPSSKDEEEEAPPAKPNKFTRKK